MKSRLGKSIAKVNLPEKNCATCQRPFQWRKKWEKVWDEVRYCSDRCRNMKGSRTEITRAADRI